MALQLGALRDALLDARRTADKTAEALAAYENRLSGIETKTRAVTGRHPKTLNDLRQSPRLIRADASRRIAATPAASCQFQRRPMRTRGRSMPPSWPIGAAPASWARISGSSMRSIAPVRSTSLPLAIGDHHLQLADRVERRGSPSDKIIGLRPYPTG
jgi:hypothetical protein